MAENAARTRNQALRDTTSAEIKYAHNGQILAFALTILAFVAAVVFFLLGNEIAGCAFLSVPVLMLIRSFLSRGGDD